ncbi:toll-like receptor 4 [Bacillus rossius redtenbacheri]|uniref:toll-like receptor 4 n=1 Tax=Bacillus rossius redtenbacheri TaxID=93214 RepID=UPI002FDD59D6
MPALKVIDLSYNFIVRLAWDVISQLLSLEKLILSENLITVSDNLHNRQSYNSCRNSSVNIISPFSVQTDINRSEYRYNVCDSANNSFDVNIFGKSKLVTLSLEWNCLATLVGNVFTNSSSSLQHVRFTHNRIREIGNKAFANTVNLKLLDLSYNSLSVINNYTFRSLTQLVLLNLEHNELELIEEGAFHNLNSLLSLAIAFNKLKTFNFNTFPQENSLIAFSAHNNPLVSLETTIHLTHLTTLNVSNSLLMAGLKVFDSMPSLHVLDVSNTSLCEIGVESFRNTNHLHHLTLGSSCLRGLACSHFDSLNRLLFLRFSIEEPDANALDTHISWKNLTLIKRLVRKTLPGVPCPHWTSHMPGSAKGADYRELISFGHVEMGYLLVLIGPAKHDRVTRWHVHGGCFFTLRLLPRGLFLKRNHIESGSIWTSLKSVSHIKTHAVYTFNAFA